MADAILALSLHEVRQAVRTPDAVQDAVADAISAHLATCPVAGQGRRGALVALAMRPWPWLFATVAVFSPHAPRIVETIRRTGRQIIRPRQFPCSGCADFCCPARSV